MYALSNKQVEQDLPKVSITGLVNGADLVVNMLDIRVRDSLVKSDCKVLVGPYRNDYVAVVNSWLVGTITFKATIEKRKN